MKENKYLMCVWIGLTMLVIYFTTGNFIPHEYVTFYTVHKDYSWITLLFIIGGSFIAYGLGGLNAFKVLEKKETKES